MTSVTKRTLLFGSIRSFAFGVLETGPKTFFLLIVVDHFSAGDGIKTIVSLPQAFGMIAALFVVSYLGRIALPKNILVSACLIISAFAFGASALANTLFWHVLWLVPAAATGAITTPLYVAIIKENYPASLRGRLFAIELLVAMLGSALFHLLGGSLLAMSSDNYRWLIAVFGVANLIAAAALLFVPDQSPKTDNTCSNNTSLLSTISLLWQDVPFGLTVGAWFIFGLGYLLIAPIRILFLTEQQYGFNLTATQIALIAGTIPDLTRLLFTPVWAALFDRYNFINIRVCTNIILIAGIIIYFQFSSILMVSIGSALLGVFSAGGHVGWHLWVTRFADQRQTSAYMSVHSFATGIRAIIGAIIGIQIASRAGALPVAWIAVSCVVVGTIVLLPLRRYEQRFAPPKRSDS